LPTDILTLWYAKLWAAGRCVSFSPIDLIPDFIPIIGFLDDLLLVPAGIWVALKLIPAHALERGREQAKAWLAAKREEPRNIAMAIAIGLVWAVAAVLLGWWAWEAYSG
jgi:uncharacterized membrane protein YkvA (DUF1232 family)